VKSREIRQREARCWGLWVLVAVAGLLFLYVLIEGASTPGMGAVTSLITAAAILTGECLGSRLTQRQRREEENQRRGALATMLLHELQLLKRILNDIRNTKTPGGLQEIALFHTAVYNQAGVNLALFTSNTVHIVMSFYHQVHALQEQLTQLIEQARGTNQPISGRLGLQDELREQATLAADAIPEVERRLKAEGGKWLQN
jgi:K+-sensing histidine kinase KdpD